MTTGSMEAQGLVVSKGGAWSIIFEEGRAGRLVLVTRLFRVTFRGTNSAGCTVHVQAVEMPKRREKETGWKESGWKK